MSRPSDNTRSKVRSNNRRLGFTNSFQSNLKLGSSFKLNLEPEVTTEQVRRRRATKQAPDYAFRMEAKGEMTRAKKGIVSTASGYINEAGEYVDRAVKYTAKFTLKTVQKTAEFTKKHGKTIALAATAVTLAVGNTMIQSKLQDAGYSSFQAGLVGTMAIQAIRAIPILVRRSGKEALEHVGFALTGELAQEVAVKTLGGTLGEFGGRVVGIFANGKFKGWWTAGRNERVLQDPGALADQAVADAYAEVGTVETKEEELARLNATRKELYKSVAIKAMAGAATLATLQGAYNGTFMNALRVIPMPEMIKQGWRWTQAGWVLTKDTATVKAGVATIAGMTFGIPAGYLSRMTKRILRKTLRKLKAAGRTVEPEAVAELRAKIFASVVEEQHMAHFTNMLGELGDLAIDASFQAGAGMYAKQFSEKVTEWNTLDEARIDLQNYYDATHQKAFEMYQEAKELGERINPLYMYRELASMNGDIQDGNELDTAMRYWERQSGANARRGLDAVGTQDSQRLFRKFQDSTDMDAKVATERTFGTLAKPIQEPRLTTATERRVKLDLLNEADYKENQAAWNRGTSRNDAYFKRQASLRGQQRYAERLSRQDVNVNQRLIDPLARETPQAAREAFRGAPTGISANPGYTRTPAEVKEAFTGAPTGINVNPGYARTAEESYKAFNKAFKSAARAIAKADATTTSGDRVQSRQNFAAEQADSQTEDTTLDDESFTMRGLAYDFVEPLALSYIPGIGTAAGVAKAARNVIVRANQAARVAHAASLLDDDSILVRTPETSDINDELLYGGTLPAGTSGYADLPAASVAGSIHSATSRLERATNPDNYIEVKSDTLSAFEAATSTTVNPTLQGAFNEASQASYYTRASQLIWGDGPTRLLQHVADAEAFKD